MSYPKVAILLLNWNGKEDTVECLNSLKSISYPDYKILLIDNDSTDGSVEYFRQHYPESECIVNEKNLGFAAGNNVGIKLALSRNYDYVLLLNNDTIADHLFLNELVDAAEIDPEVGFAGPMIYYYGYDEQKDIINFIGGKIDLYRGKSSHIGLKEKDVGQYRDVREVDYAEGSCLLVKSELIKKIGLLDPEYFVYWEEVDWCMRGHKAGYKTISVPKAKIWHKVSATSNKRSGTLIYYMTKNSFSFMKKYASHTQYFLFTVYFILFEFWYRLFIYGIYHRDMTELKAFFKGICHSFIKM